MCRVVCSVSAAAASTHTSWSKPCVAPMARPAKTTYSLPRSKTESSHAPSLENVRV